MKFARDLGPDIVLMDVSLSAVEEEATGLSMSEAGAVTDLAKETPRRPSSKAIRAAAGRS